MDEITDSWYSLSWFSPTTLQGFTWENKVFIYLILAVPVLFIVRWMVRHYLNQKLPVALIKSDLKSSPLNWIRIFPDKPISKKPAETRMGKGKGGVDHYVAVIKPGRILFEIDGIEPEKAKEAFRLAMHKLPIKTTIIARED